MTIYHYSLIYSFAQTKLTVSFSSTVHCHMHMSHEHESWSWSWSYVSVWWRKPSRPSPLSSAAAAPHTLSKAIANTTLRPASFAHLLSHGLMIRRISRITSQSLRKCLYHSYPDPSEKPIVSFAKSQLSTVGLVPVDKTVQLAPLSAVPMDAAYPGFETLQGYVRPSDKITDAPSIQHTVLANGLTVASQDSFSLMTTIAFVIGSGSAYENQVVGTASYNGGATNMIELLAFKSSYTMKESEIKTKIEKLGGMVQCVANRESILYCVDVLRANVEPAMELLADTVLNPLFSDEAIESGRATMGYMYDEARAEMLSRDAIVQSAYMNQSLGNFHMCPLDRAGAVTAETIQSFRIRHLYGENCMLSAAGIEHEVFVKLAEKLLKNVPGRGVGRAEVKAQAPSARYFGGLLKNQRPLREPFVKLALGFEVGGWSDKNFTTVCVLQSLLGGGSSFSAGGPGKGMYSRLYRDVLNKHYWVEAAESFMSIHENAGILGIDGACMAENSEDMIRVILGELMRLTYESVTPIELSRAKNMLKSMLLMQLESRLVLCEDIARQYITYGKRRAPEEACKEIDAVTAEDITRLARDMFTRPPSVGCVGEDLSRVPSYNNVLAMIEGYRVKLARAGHVSF